MKVPDPKDQWFVLKCLWGAEKEIQGKMLARIKSEKMENFVFSVVTPEQQITEIQKGKPVIVTRMVYEGYVVLNAHVLTPENELVPETHYFLKETEGLFGYAGENMYDVGWDHLPRPPIPLLAREVADLKNLIQSAATPVPVTVSFKVGDVVRITDGPFMGQTGLIEEFEKSTGKMKLRVEIFGRTVEVGVTYLQVESLN